MRSSLNDAFEAVQWEKIHAYMLLTNWTWSGKGRGVPSIEDMKLTVQSLMSEVWRSDLPCTSASTGGFAVNKWTWPRGSTEYEITFDIALRA